MRLRAKALVVVGTTMLILFLLLWGAANFILTSRYQDAEKRDAALASTRAADALEADIAALDDSALAWAASDSTFRFMQHSRVVSASALFPENTLARQGISFLVLLDEKAHIAYSAALDLDLEVGTEPPKGLLATLRNASDLRKPGDPHGAVRGIMQTPAGPAMVAARSITTNDAYTPPDGTLIVGRYLDAGEAERLSDSLGMPVTLMSAGGTIPEGAFQAMASDDQRFTSWWEPESADVMFAYARMNDISGRPAVLIRSELTREARASMQSAITGALIALLSLCVAATFTVYILVTRAILHPVEQLSAQVQAIALRGDHTARVDPPEAGELGTLAENVNGMLTSLEAAETQLRRSHDDLEQRVQQRTAQLAMSNAKHRELVERMADAVFSVDLDGIVTLVNEQAVEMTGSSRADLIGREFVDLMTMGTAGEVDRRLQSVPGQREKWTVEALMKSATGDAIPVELRAAPFSDTEGRIAGTQWIARDMTERLRYESQLVHLATHDGLTGLANRHSFETALDLEIAEAMRDGHRGAVIWLDLDDFKDVNDTLGHASGDEALSVLANMLSRNTRGSDVLARVGGDEFAVLMPRVTREQAELAAERLLNSIVNYTFALEGRSVRLGASLGVVFFPDNGTTVREVLSNADVAMYRAKDAGRSRVWMTTEMEDSEQLHVSRMKWNERINTALKREAFVVYAQPIWDLRDGGGVARHELLIRMVSEDGGLYPPSDFLPVAERLGLINEIDRWMIEQAIRILESEDGEIQAVEVNLSGKAFADSTLVTLISQELQRSKIDPRRLGFEITETAAIADMARAQWFIRNLKEMGCRFSLDDFGTGFSSFYYLKHLPIDCIKIDGSYVRGLSESQEDQCLVRGIREMCRGLGVEVLAECVESEDAFDAVRDLGLDYAQGYYLGRPAPVEKIVASEE